MASAAAEALQFQTRFARAALDPPNLFRAQYRRRTLCVALGNNRHHANTHVENLVHLSGIHIPIFLQDFKDAWSAPAFRLDHRIAVFR